MIVSNALPAVITRSPEGSCSNRESPGCLPPPRGAARESSLPSHGHDTVTFRMSSLPDREEALQNDSFPSSSTVNGLTGAARS